MKEIDIFSSSVHRTVDERVNKIEQANLEPKDFLDFERYGYDYFDNDEFGVGYGGYHYDGRYKGAVDAFVSLFNLKQGDSILEVGCAKGFVLYEFYKRGFEVTGVDASSYAIEHAPLEIRKRIQFNNTSKLPFPDLKFDMVLAKEVLPHLEENNALNLISECMRVSREGNVFLEIQCAEDAGGQKMMTTWDPTHKTTKPKAWWVHELTRLGFSGAYNCKKLF